MKIHSRQSPPAIHALLAPPYTTRDRLFPSLQDTWLRLLTRIEARRRHRKAVTELAAMDDRMLADIGVSRGDVPHVAGALPPLFLHR